MNLLALFHRGANHAQRRPVTARCQRPRVAMRQHAAFIRQQRSAKRAHRFARRNVFVVHRVRLGQDLFLDSDERVAVRDRCRKQALHAVDGPEQIHCTNPLELRLKLSRRLRLGLQRAKSHAVGSGNANRRRTPHDHGDNHIRHLFVIRGKHIGLLKGELRLVNKSDAFGGPIQCGNHAVPV